ncbi:MAG: acetate kinase, partial [Bacteroidota bacterium]
KWICEYLAPFGTTLDMGKNKNCTDHKKITEISTAKSKVHVLVIPTHEELQIYTACKTMGLLR